MKEKEENYRVFLRNVGQGAISGNVSEWPQLKPACAWADAELTRLWEVCVRMESCLERIASDGDDKGADMALRAERCLEWLTSRRRAGKEGG